MKTYLIISLLTFSSFFFAQEELINQIDTNGLKQGKWIVYGFMKPEKNYPDSAIVEEGIYVDGRRDGFWRFYHLDNVVRLEVFFLNNKAVGEYKRFFASGVLKEEGCYRLGKQVDTKKVYFENGCLKRETIFDESGKAILFREYSKTVCNEEVKKPQSYRKDYKGSISDSNKIGNKKSIKHELNDTVGLHNWYDSPFPINHCDIGVYDILIKREVHQIDDLLEEERKSISKLIHIYGANSVYLEFNNFTGTPITQVKCHLIKWDIKIDQKECYSLKKEFQLRTGYLEYNQTYENLVEFRHFQKDKIPKYLQLVDSFNIELKNEISWIDEMKNETKAEIVADAVRYGSPFVYFDYRCVSGENGKHRYTYYLFRWPEP